MNCIIFLYSMTQCELPSSLHNVGAEKYYLSMPIPIVPFTKFIQIQIFELLIIYTGYT